MKKNKQKKVTCSFCPHDSMFTFKQKKESFGICINCVKKAVGTLIGQPPFISKCGNQHLI